MRARAYQCVHAGPVYKMKVEESRVVQTLLMKSCNYLFRYNDATPSCITNIINRRVAKDNLRSCHKLVVSRFNTYYMNNSVAHRGSIVWKALTPYYRNANTTGEYARNVRGTHALNYLDFKVESPQQFRDRNDTFIVH